MGRNSMPFYRSKRGAYYCWIDGHLKSFGKTKRLADEKYRQLIAGKDEASKPKPWTVRECFDHYLDHASTMKPNTHRNQKSILDSFCEEARVAALPFHELTVDQLEAWLRKHPDWSPSWRRSAINYVMAAFNYCVKRKKIEVNPIHGIKKPQAP